MAPASPRGILSGRVGANGAGSRSLELPGSIAFPEAAIRLETLRNVRWLAAGAFRTEAPLARVVDHFRGQAAAVSSTPRSARLEEWLEKNPGERAAYREFERAQASSAAPEWQSSAQTVADIPASLGGGSGIPPELARRPIEIAFGRVVGPGTVTSIQLVSLSSHPTGLA